MQQRVVQMCEIEVFFIAQSVDFVFSTLISAQEEKIRMEYSVLMSVYAKEEPVYLDTAIQSMLDQTVRTDDFVIVCDGPLTAELEAVLERHLAQNPAVLHLVRLPQNIGTGAALNIGLTHCKNELIAKMDSDDISVLDRCERQLKEFAEDDRLTVVGGNILEFTEDPARPVSRRLVPCDNEGIQKYARSELHPIC